MADPPVPPDASRSAMFIRRPAGQAPARWRRRARVPKSVVDWNFFRKKAAPAVRHSLLATRTRARCLRVSGPRAAPIFSGEMLLRDLIKNLSNPAPDVDPEDRAFGGEGAKLAAEDESLYEGSEALTRRSKLRPLDDMGASYRGSVVSRADMGEEVSEDGESACESADESAGESDASRAVLAARRRVVRGEVFGFSVDPPQVRRFIKGSTVSPQPKLRSPAAGGGADAASSSSSGNDAEEFR